MSLGHSNGWLYGEATVKTVVNPRPTRNPRKIIFETPINSYWGLNDIRNAKGNLEKFNYRYRQKMTDTHNWGHFDHFNHRVEIWPKCQLKIKEIKNIKNKFKLWIK